MGSAFPKRSLCMGSCGFESRQGNNYQRRAGLGLWGDPLSYKQMQQGSIPWLGTTLPE